MLPSYNVSVQGWKVPPREAPIQGMTLRVYPFAPKGVRLEADLLKPMSSVQYKYSYYKVLKCPLSYAAAIFGPQCRSLI